MIRNIRNGCDNFMKRDLSHFSLARPINADDVFSSVYRVLCAYLVAQFFITLEMASPVTIVHVTRQGGEASHQGHRC